MKVEVAVYTVPVLAPDAVSVAPETSAPRRVEDAAGDRSPLVCPHPTAPEIALNKTTARTVRTIRNIGPPRDCSEHTERSRPAALMGE